MRRPRSPQSPRRAARWIGLTLFAVALVGGLLLGSASTLHLQRDADGSVTATNTWRFAGGPILLRRTVTHLHEARLEAMDLSERERRSSAYRDLLGGLRVPDQLVLRGDSELAYPYREDLALIRGFLRDAHRRELSLAQPADVRRVVAAWLLIALAALSALGWLLTRRRGRDPLRRLPARVRPLPPRLAGLLLLATGAAVAGFFTFGHRVFGPVADAKVDLLFTAASTDDAAGIATAAARGVFLEVRDGQGMTALHLAARAGAVHAVRTLLGAGARPDPVDADGRTPLLWAVQLGQVAVAEALLTADADVTAADANGRTALHLAAERGDAASVRRLLEAGAEVDRPDAHGWRALHFAAGSGSAAAVEALLAAHADPRRRLPDGRLAADLASADGALRVRLGVGAAPP